MTDKTTRCKSNNRLELCRMPVLVQLFCFFFLLSFEQNFRFCLGLNSEGKECLFHREKESGTAIKETIVTVIRSSGFYFFLGIAGLALLRLRERVAGDPSNALSSWNGDDADPCSWLGVKCFDGKVVALNLKDLSLRGTLAPELGNLSHIRSIILRNNSFYGTFPKEILVLKELEVLDLGQNDFNGPIPFELVNNLSLMTFLLDNKLMQSENLVDENHLRAVSHDIIFLRNGGQTVDFVPQSRRLLQASRPAKIDMKKENNLKASSPSQVPSPAPSPSHSAHNSPQGPQQRSKSKPKNQASAPSPSPSHKAHSPAHAPTVKRTNSSASPSSSPSPSPSPSQKVHSPAHAPILKNSTTSSSKKAPVGAPPPVPSHSSPAPSAAVTLSGNSSKGHGVVIGLSVAGGSLVVVLSVIAIVICQSSKVVTVKPWATGLSGQLQRAFVTGVPKLKRAELETACEDFSNIIGTLSDSTVYKGTLSSGVEIAVVSSLVKSRQQWSKNLQAQFRKKLETLSKVNHKNFVNLIGYCEEEKPFTRMMVFEYAPNGTLFEHLHIREAERLDWRMRLRIVMGLAYCLEHMHQLDPPIPQRDLQSSSVYLSQDYAAKLSDFSFWTEITSEKMRSPSMQLLEASLADKESNIHNFGVLLLEIITGRIPYSHSGSVEDWVWEYLRSDDLPREKIDPTLTTFQEKEIPKLYEIIKDCMHPDPKERPKMREVAIKLMEIAGIEPDGATPSISPLWWAELEVMATEAS